MGGCLTRRLGVSPTGPTTDPNFASTVLLVGPVNSVGSASVTDESFAAHGSLTSPGINNDAQVDGGITLFGQPTMRFDTGLNDQFETADHADWTLGTNLVTMEGFVYLEANSTALIFLSHYNTSSQRGWAIQYRGDLVTDELAFVGSSNGTSAAFIVSGAVTIPIQTWYYWCYERAASNVHRVYAGPLGGTASMLAKATNSISIFNSTALLHINGTDNLANNINGNMGEIRITNNVARYDTDAGYPVPTAKFPRS